MQTTAGSALKIASLLTDSASGQTSTVEHIHHHGTTELLVALVPRLVVTDLLENSCLRLQGLAASGLRRTQITGQPFTIYLTSGVVPVSSPPENDLCQMRGRSHLVSRKGSQAGHKVPTFVKNEEAESDKLETNQTAEEAIETDELPALTPTQLNVMKMSFRLKKTTKRGEHSSFFIFLRRASTDWVFGAITLS